MARILIAEDDPGSRDYLKTVLATQGHETLVASDGMEALDLARRERPTLLISDILMPRMDGFELVRQIRADQAIALTAAIFLSATYNIEEAKELAATCGVMDVLSKPIEPQLLLQAVKTALQCERTASSYSTDQFDREHLRLVTDKLYLKSRVADARERLNRLVSVVHKMTVEPSPEELLESFCAEARSIVDATTCFVGRFVKDGAVRWSSCGPLGSSELIACIEESLPSLIARLGVNKRCLRFRSTQEAFNISRLGAAADLPLLTARITAGNNTYGLFFALGKPSAAQFSAEDESITSTLTTEIAVVYENMLRETELERRARILEMEVADRRRAEQALLRSEAEYRSIVEGAPYGIFRVTQEGRILMANPALARMLGYSSSTKLVGLDTKAELYRLPEDRERVVVTYGSGAHVEAEWRRQDGSPLAVRLIGRALPSSASDAPVFEVFVEDISQRRQLEEQLRQAQKMEAVGRLAGGVAHDFNNLLQVIGGCAQMADRAGQDPVRLQEYARQIYGAVERGAGLTRQLLAFSRQQVLRPEVLDLNTVILESGEMLPQLLGEEIQLRLALSAEPGSIKADATQIQQVLLNLAANARDAMPHGGALIIETAKLDLDQPDSKSYPVTLPAGSYVVLTVSDTGTGMDEQTRARIFDPFFTTKELGKGTGLGLASVFGIVKQSSGYIFVDSEIGRGTSFTIYLPATTEHSVKDTAGSPEPATGGNETILLVEDESLLREVTADYLRSNGYDVLEASGGADALDVCRIHAGRIHVLITDLAMPGMGGGDLVRAARQIRPDLRVIYLSGYSDQNVERHRLEPDGLFLQKPVSLTDLGNAVRARLDRNDLAPGT